MQLEPLAAAHQACIGGRAPSRSVSFSAFHVQRSGEGAMRNLLVDHALHTLGVGAGTITTYRRRAHD